MGGEIERRAASQRTGGAGLEEVSLDPLKSGRPGDLLRANEQDLLKDLELKQRPEPDYLKYARLDEVDDNIPHANRSYLNETYSNDTYGKNTVGAAQSAYPNRQKVSKVHSNTIENSPMFSRTEKELLNQNEFQYDVISERRSIAEAKQRLQVDFDGEVKTLMNKAYFDGTDIDTAFGVLEQFRREAQGLPLDSPEQQRVIDWVKQIQQKGTEAGQRVQAYAKYSRTPEGAAVKAQKYVTDRLDKLQKKDPNLFKAMDDLADKLGKIAKEYQYELPSNPEETVEKLRKAVQGLIDDKAYRRLDLDEAFTDRVIQSLQEGRAGKDTFADMLKEIENIPSITGDDLMNIMDTMAKAENLPVYSRARLELENQAYKIVADKFPSSFMDKWNSWRYMAMLGNPRTHIRNVVGNTVFGGVTRIKNDVGALLEAAADRISRAAGGKGIERTKALLNPFDGADRALQQAAKGDYDNVYALITGGGKYNPTRMIEDNRTVFKHGWPEKLRKGNMDWLELEDNVALKARYSENLTRYLKANGYGPEIFKDTSEAAQAALDEARGYAILEAQKATFRDYSKAAATISKFSQVNPLTNVLTEGLLPFKKTPVNIVRRGIEYSPIGLADGIRDTFKAVKRGSVSASQAIDKLAAGLTGSGIMLLGGFLASQGYLTGAGSEDAKERSYNKMMGEQSYALKLGDYSYTLDWMAPAAMPLFAGVELWNAAAQREGNFTGGDFMDAMERITGPVVEMSMLQGLNSAVKTAGYSQAHALPAMAGNAVANYFGQAIPTVSGQIARTIDGVRRNSYYVDKNSQIPQTLQIALQKTQAKIPDLLPGRDALERFTSKGLQPYMDAWGRESAQKPAALRAFENFLSPGYISKVRTTPADDVIKDLYRRNGNRAVLPSEAQKSFAVDGETVNLTAAQYAEAGKIRGQTAQRLIAGLGRLPAFAGLESADRERVVSDAYSYATAVAKQQVSGYQPDGWIEKAQQAEQAGIPVETYLLYKNAFSELEGYEDGSGEYISKPDQQAQMLLADPTLTGRQKNLLDDLLISDVIVMQKDVKRDYTSPEALAVSSLPDAQQNLYNTPSVKKAVGSVSNFIKVQNIISEIKADKDEYGNSKSGTAKPKEIAAIASALNVSSEQANEIYNELVVYKHDISELSSKQRRAYQSLAGKYKISDAWFLDCLNAMAVVEGEKDRSGKTISGSLKRKRYQRLLQMGMNESGAQVFLSEVYGYKW